MKKDKIYINDWLLYKPYKTEDSVDLYYLKVANEIYERITKKKIRLLNLYVNNVQKKMLTCFLLCYFEDIISETNIWFSFKNKYKELYNKTLPFFKIDKKEYIDDEFNKEDIAFLVWYFINLTEDDFFIAPYHDDFVKIANICADIFEKHYEYAPENKRLKKLFTLNKNSNLYKVRAFMKLIFFNSYLLMIDILPREEEERSEVLKLKEEKPLKLAYLREIEELYAFSKKTKLLALDAKEWTSLIIGKSHPLHNDICNISNKITGGFLYKGQDETTVFLEHIASNRLFEMTKESFDHYKELVNDDIVIIGLVKWKNKWWFSGSYTKKSFDADYILDIKNSHRERTSVNFLEIKEIKETLKIGEKAFLKYNNNSLVALIKESELEGFINSFTAFYNSSLKLSKKEKEEAKERVKKDGYFGGKEKKDSFSQFEKGEDIAVVFYNPNSGLEFYFGIDNAFLKPESSYDFKVKEEINRLFISNEYSTELVNYYIKNYKSKVDLLKIKPFSKYLKNIDFLLRFWKSDNYKTTPKQALIGTKN